MVEQGRAYRLLGAVLSHHVLVYSLFKIAGVELRNAELCLAEHGTAARIHRGVVGAGKPGIEIWRPPSSLQRPERGEMATAHASRRRTGPAQATTTSLHRQNERSGACKHVARLPDSAVGWFVSCRASIHADSRGHQMWGSGRTAHGAEDGLNQGARDRPGSSSCCRRREPGQATRHDTKIRAREEDVSLVAVQQATGRAARRRQAMRVPVIGWWSTGGSQKSAGATESHHKDRQPRHACNTLLLRTRSSTQVTVGWVFRGPVLLRDYFYGLD